MTMYGYDVDFYKPTIKLLKAHRANFVMGYLSHDPAKNMTKAYADKVRKNGMGIGLVWETTARRASGTFANGQSDAYEAMAQSSALGFPTFLPIYFAVDFDAVPSQVHDYFDGVKATIHDRTGVYGSYRVVNDLYYSNGIKWTWQTLAWSGSKWFRHNTMEQTKIEIDWGPGKVDADTAPSRYTWELHGLWRPLEVTK